MPSLSGDDVHIKIGTESDTHGVDEAEKRIGGFSKSTVEAASAVSKAFLATGAVVAAALGYSIKQAADFQTALANVNTVVGNTAQIDKFHDAILEMTKVIPKSADELGAGLYDIVSAGITDTSQALDVLRESAKLGVAGLGSTAQATDLMTSAMNAFRSQGLTASEASRIFFQAVNDGKVTVDSLSQGFGQVAPLAAQMGVNFKELNAAVAAMSANGQPAAQAYTNIEQAMVALITPNTTMKVLFDALGIASGEAAIKQYGLVGTMELLNKASQGNSDMLGQAYGRVQAYSGALALTGNAHQQFVDTLGHMTGGVNHLNDAFAVQQATVNNQLKILQNELNRAAIALGEKLLPYVIQFVHFIINTAVPAITNLVHWFEQHRTITAILAGVITGLLVIGLASLIITVVSAVGVFIGFIGTIAAVGGGIVGFVAIAIGAAVAGFLWLNSHTKLVNAAFQVMGNVIKTIMEAIKSAIVTYVNQSLAPLNALISAINWILSHIPQLSNLKIPNVGIHNATGTNYFGGGMTWVGERGPELVSLPQGSQIIPNHVSQGMGGGSGSPQVVMYNEIHEQADWTPIVNKLNWALATR